MRAEIREARRLRLVESAVRVFARKGYRAASVADILEEAGVARGTFYLYFSSKLDVFQAILDLALASFSRMARAESEREFSPKDVPGEIRRALLAWLEYFHHSRELAAVVFRHAPSLDPDYREKAKGALDPMYSHWETKIAEHQKLGITNPRLDPRFVRVCVLGMFSQIFLDLILPDPEPDLERIADQMLTLLAQGVRPM